MKVDYDNKERSFLTTHEKLYKVAAAMGPTALPPKIVLNMYRRMFPTKVTDAAIAISKHTKGSGCTQCLREGPIFDNSTGNYISLVNGEVINFPTPVDLHTMQDQIDEMWLMLKDLYERWGKVK